MLDRRKFRQLINEIKENYHLNIMYGNTIDNDNNELELQLEQNYGLKGEIEYIINSNDLSWVLGIIEYDKKIK